tara:strand:- start:137 stop:268 length:132 start_codon:yes stop_codon:yes gene_type:complete
VGGTSVKCIGLIYYLDKKMTYDVEVDQRYERILEDSKKWDLAE